MSMRLCSPATHRVSRGARLFGALCLFHLAGGCATHGDLTLRVLGDNGNDIVPARVEIVGPSANPVVLPGAVPLTIQCTERPPPQAELSRIQSDRIVNPHTGTTQFYLADESTGRLPAGRYLLRVFVGNEHQVVTREVDIEAGDAHEVTVHVNRLVDMRARGWYSADGHLHITRRTPEDSLHIAQWLRAEDLHVGNLLQMGTIDRFDVSPQLGFGDAGTFRYGNTLLISGQEQPRTHILGHTITLGPDAPYDEREEYLEFDSYAEAAHAHGGAFGFAHFGFGSGGQDGATVFGPTGGIDFLEVLQFEWPFYDVWYDLLDVGQRVAPIAGTDFPCGNWSMPGRERFYTKVDGPLTRESWIAGVRAARTFVTNGPLVEFSIDGKDIGETLSLSSPGSVLARGQIHYDPDRDDIQQVEIIHNSRAIEVAYQQSRPGRIAFAVPLDIDGPAWVALRVSGDKKSETLAIRKSTRASREVAKQFTRFVEMGRRIEVFLQQRDYVRPTAAHTAPVWIEVAGEHTHPVVAASRVPAALARLAALEARLSDKNIGGEQIADWVPYSDGVPLTFLKRNRPQLLRAIAKARARYEALATRPASPPPAGPPPAQD